jgi:hypothetical protein
LRPAIVAVLRGVLGLHLKFDDVLGHCCQVEDARK